MITTLGGVLPNVSGEVNAAALLSQLSAVTALADLYDLVNILGRMATNIEAIGASGHYVTLAGGDLYRMARDAYGDATEWATIARVNGLTDPQIGGVTTVLVPPIPGGTGGVLSEVLPAPSGAAAIYPFTPPADEGGSGVDLDFSDPDNAIWLTII